MFLKKVVSLTLPEETVEKIDRTSRALGLNRSELVALLIEKGFDFPDDVLASVREISKLQKEATEKVLNRRRSNAE